MSPRELSLAVQAPVLEVFASLQGEGAFVGEPQVFLRLRGCPLRCRWCDTPGSWKLGPDDQARVAACSGARREPAWASAFQAACWVGEVEPGSPRTVSVTGGEPLAWPDFLLALKPLLGPRRLHLETAGAHPRSLARVLSVCDHVSLDLKPERDLDPPEELPAQRSELAQPFALAAGAFPGGARESSPQSFGEWKSAREACLRLVAGRDAAAKIVVSGAHAAEDYAELLDEVEECAATLPVFLTPVTPIAGVPAAPRALLEGVAEMARDRDLSVRVVPQVHRLLGVP